MAPVDVSPLLAAAHQFEYRPRYLRIAVDHLVVAAGHEQTWPTNERRSQVGAKRHWRRRNDAGDAVLPERAVPAAVIDEPAVSLDRLQQGGRAELIRRNDWERPGRSFRRPGDVAAVEDRLHGSEVPLIRIELGLFDAAGWALNGDGCVARIECTDRKRDHAGIAVAPRGDFVGADVYARE